MTPSPALIGVMGGALAMGYAVAALFFLRFFARTRDTLFLAFAGAFALLALNQLLPVLSGLPGEEQSGFYLLRLAGFLVIIVAILSKNLRRGS